MLAREQREAYQKIKQQRQTYGVFHKCLFHIHSPASYDYCLRTGHSSEFYGGISVEDIFDMASCEGLFQNKVIESHSDLPDDAIFCNRKEYIAYLLIAHKLFQNRIELAIISDHNTINGLTKLKRAIELYNENKTDSIYTHLFLGIEVSCADKNHVVGIFDPAQTDTNEKIQRWISEIIMSEKDGTFYTSYDVLSQIEDKLGGIAYIAHIDTSDTFSKHYLSQGYRRTLFSKHHTAVGVSDIEKRNVIMQKIKDLQHNDTAIIWDNDAHSIDDISEKAFWIKGQKINFSMLKDAMCDYDVAICYGEPKEPRQFILGLAINGDMNSFLVGGSTGSGEYEPFSVQFSDSLNCFIGGRGTGKTSVLSIINFVLGQRLPVEKKSGKSFLESICKYHFITVFYRYENEDYAVSFSQPVKENFYDDILKSFTEPTPYNQKFSYDFPYDCESIAAYTRKKYIDLYRISKDQTTAEQVLEPNKHKLLTRFFSSGYSVNDLVNTAGSDQLGTFIHSLLLKNKTFSQPSIRKGEYAKISDRMIR